MIARARAKTMRRGKIGALFMVSSLLIGSAVIRVGVGVGPAISGELARQQDDTSQGSKPPNDSRPTRAELDPLLQAFQAREERLKAREMQIADRMRALEIADQAIERKIAALETAEAQLSATLTIADGASDQDLTRLTSVYERMKPKETAALFEKMDPGFAAGFLGRMRPEVAAAVMAGLEPDAAYSISVILAGRNALVPKK